MVDRPASVGRSSCLGLRLDDVIAVDETARWASHHQPAATKWSIDEITLLFKSLHQSKDVWMREVASYGLRTIANQRLTFIDLAALLGAVV